MKKIVAIGGGENGRFLEDGSQTLYETEIIDKEILDDKYKIICSETNRLIQKGYAIKCYWADNTFHEEKLESTNNYQPLSNLLNK